MRLEERVAIVTGAAHGIGRAICVELAREGAQVWACDVRAPELAATRAAVDAVRPGAGQAAAVDVRDGRAVADFVARVEDRKSTRLNSSHVSLSRMPSSA